MKRKPLSMKKLHVYAVEFLVAKYKKDADKLDAKDVWEKSEVKEFLDYIWKNPK